MWRTQDGCSLTDLIDDEGHQIGHVNRRILCGDLHPVISTPALPGSIERRVVKHWERHGPFGLSDTERLGP